MFALLFRVVLLTRPPLKTWIVPLETISPVLVTPLEMLMTAILDGPSFPLWWDYGM